MASIRPDSASSCPGHLPVNPKFICHGSIYQMIGALSLPVRGVPTYRSVYFQGPALTSETSSRIKQMPQAQAVLLLPIAVV